jgi:8-oxo-dGTP diphosphatase
VIERSDGSFLLGRRPAGKVYAGWWEFPGGKIHDGESAERALARELHEELGIELRRAYPWITRVFAYPHATVRLSFFRVVEWSGEPRAIEHQALVWQRLDRAIAEPMLPANAPVLAALALPWEYAITNASTVGVPAALEHLERRLKEGLKLVQVREPGMAEGERAAFTSAVVELAHRHGARVLVKSPFPGADGLHVTARELMQLTARPAQTLVAASCHTREELEAAMRLGLDFAVLGPVRPTGTKEAGLDWSGFAALARGASVPVYAIGGLTRADFEDAWRAGAHGLAMIRGSWS